MQMNISDEIAARLTAIAESQGTSVDDVLETLLDQYTPPAKGTLADLARIALETGLSSEVPVDAADRSREILSTEYADYLKERLDSNGDHSR